MKRPTRALLSLVLLGAAPACRSSQPLGEALYSESDRQAVETVLDDWHAAAAEADSERYFGHMSPDAVFLGTDASERWRREQFQAYTLSHFSTGQGWTYRPMERHVYFGPGRTTAWFDERLWNEKYGECRGTGALRKIDGEWKVAHYNLCFPVPNAVAPELIQLIRAYQVEASAKRR